MAEEPTQERELPLLVSPATCSGKTYIVTGGNSGLGFEAAQHLAKAGAAKIILAVRNLTAGEAAKAKIDAAAAVTGTSTPDQVAVWHLDLTDYESVQNFVKRAETELPRIDALILNAGISLTERVVVRGHIATVTVNVISTLLLAVLMLPVMSAQAKSGKGADTPRIVVVTSQMGFSFREVWEMIKEDPIAGLDSESMPAFPT
jgi:NAD(P)-dependent dehydrogenase (short-subunit alcohol dehydrogenase family)